MIHANEFNRLWLEDGNSLLKVIDQVIKSGQYILGGQVKDFEQNLASFCHTKYAVGCGNGMEAIEISLKLLGIKPYEPVITTPLTAYATTLAIYRAGGIPLLIDVDKEGLIDLNLVESLLAKDKTIKFFLPVHLYGFCLNQDKLRYLKNKYHLRLIEDMSQAIGASFNQKSVGSAGQISTLSFYPTKNLGAIGDGGGIITNTKSLHIKAKAYRNYGEKSKYHHYYPGLNSRLDEIQAAILNYLITNKLAKFTQKRQAVAATYLNKIHCPYIIKILPHHLSVPVWHLFPIKVVRRTNFINYCTQHGVATNIHYPKLVNKQHATRYFPAPIIPYPLTQAQKFVQQQVSLPIHPYLTDSEINYLIQVINAYKP